ncbi:MAG: hypothetical protein NC935_04830 [Candidatus Omnitrophica bacterium]|nr:hypothetical protein [Candidatus Omnitrophota bacterium]
MKKQNIISDKNLYWINFLHLYQPPWQKKEIVEEFTNKSYRYILNILKKYPKTKITMNISGCLTEQLLNYGFRDILDDIKKLTLKKQIELVGSAMYHPILPLIPEDEVIRQIKLNENINSKIFGKAWGVSKKIYGLRGFFMPEMAYSKKVAKIISKMGYEWIILDEIALDGKFNNINWSTKYYIKDVKCKNSKENFIVVFRDRKFYKNTFETEKIDKMLKNKNLNNIFIVTARDGEGYNLNLNKKTLETIEKVVRNKNVETMTISEYLKKIKNKKDVDLKRCNWESDPSEIKRKDYYSIWNNKNNEIHKKLWFFIKNIKKVVDKNKNDPNYFWARKHLDKAFTSCTWWWADGRFKGYNPDEIEKGCLEMIKSIRSLNKLDIYTKIYFEKIYSNIIFKIWEKHWKIYESCN